MRYDARAHPKKGPSFAKSHSWVATRCEIPFNKQNNVSTVA